MDVFFYGGPEVWAKKTNKSNKLKFLQTWKPNHQSHHPPIDTKIPIYSKAVGNSKPDPVLDGFWTKKTQISWKCSGIKMKRSKRMQKSQNASRFWSLEVFVCCVLNNVCACACVCLILGHCELVLAAADGFNEIWSCRINKLHLILLVFFPSVMCIKTIEVSPNVEECYWDFIEHTW